jgi:hypothetical protein
MEFYRRLNNLKRHRLFQRYFCIYQHIKKTYSEKRKHFEAMSLSIFDNNSFKFALRLKFTL